MTAPKYPPAPGVLTITQSALEEYLRCGLAYQQSRDTRYRRSTVAMAIGTGVEAGASADDLNKIHGGTALSRRDIVELSIEGYDQEVTVSEIEASQVAVADGRDETAECARVYADLVSPATTGVLASEEPLTLDLETGLRIAGTPDVVTRDGIGDRKVGQPWTPERAHKSRQLTLYSALHLEQYQTMPRRVWIDSIDRAGRTWARHWSVRTEEDLNAMFRVVEAAVAGIRAGVYLPAPEAAWWCSRKWCPHWHACPAVVRGRDDGE